MRTRLHLSHEEGRLLLLLYLCLCLSPPRRLKRGVRVAAIARVRQLRLRLRRQHLRALSPQRRRRGTVVQPVVLGGSGAVCGGHPRGQLCCGYLLASRVQRPSRGQCVVRLGRSPGRTTAAARTDGRRRRQRVQPAVPLRRHQRRRELVTGPAHVDVVQAALLRMLWILLLGRGCGLTLRRHCGSTAAPWPPAASLRKAHGALSPPQQCTRECRLDKGQLAALKSPSR